jgi:hypothetical protein
LYADYTVILAESKVELQTALNATCMYLYCKTWNLEVNASKIKAVIFSKLKISDKSVFTLNGEMLNVVDDFAYLGIMFMSNGSFSKNRVKLLEQGRKAMFSMLRKSLGLPIDIQLQMFDTMISPILLYGCEVWCFENNDAIESLFLQFYKIILGVKKSTPNCILYGELDRYRIEIFIKSRMIGLWKRLICNKQDKISAMLYKLLFTMHQWDILSF